MKLPNLPFLQTKPKAKKEYFLALLARPNSFGAILFEEIDKNLSIITSFTQSSARSLDVLTSEELVDLGDQVITEIEKSLPEGVNVEKTIFAVPYSWVEEGKIKKESLLKLKKVCDSLALTPMGFIISVEAIIAFQQKKQGAPLTAIFAEISKDAASVFLVKTGTIMESKSAAIEESAVKTVENLLRQTEKFEVFPSKFILFASDANEEVSHAFLKHKWSEDLAFLHEPHVETLEGSFEDEAIVNGVATQMGFDVLEPETAEEKKEDAEIENNNFGFLKEKDIAEVVAEKEVAEATAQIPHMKTHANVGETEELPPIQEKRVNEDTQDMVQEEEEINTSPKKNMLAPIFGIVSGMHLPKLPGFHVGVPHGNKLLIIIIGILLAVGILAFFYYNSLLKAEIAITTTQKTFQKDIDVNFSSNGSTSVSDKVVAMKVISVDVSDESTANATGTVDTGDRAKGTITIYNKTDSPKTLAKGTVVTGNNLKYDLNSEVTIASTSAFSTSFSSGDSGVTAEKFGQEYNLPSSTNFTVQGYASTDIFAKNSSALSGGTKKSVTAIAKSDLDNLASSLLSSLKGKANSQASGKVDSNSVLITDPLSGDYTSEKFSKHAGDQASSVTLKGAATYKFGAYKKSDVENLVKVQAGSPIPSEFTYVPDKSHITVKNIKVDKNGNATATLSINAIFEPQLQIDTVARDTSGKSPDVVTKKLEQNQDVADVTITFKNKLPLFPLLLPINPKHITVSIHNQ